MSKDSHHRRLVVASNRLPVAFQKQHQRWCAAPTVGGLVTALTPVLEQRGGVWIGWSGLIDAPAEMDAILEEASDTCGYDLRAVPLSAEQHDKFYYGFSNEIIWPLFHDLQSRCKFDPSYWEAYQQVNLQFARSIRAQSQPSDYIWVHDYHLMSVAQNLRRMGVRNDIGFFLHIPFPPPAIFFKLPWAEQILRALLDYDLIGFQTAEDRANFLACAERRLFVAQPRQDGHMARITYQGRQIWVGHLPIGIDALAFQERSSQPQALARTQELREAHRGQKVIFGIDRLDYTKGLVERLEAFRHTLIRYPELRGKITMVQVVVPTRTGIAEYAGLKTAVEQLVGEINGQFTEPGWVPIQYIAHAIQGSELMAFYRSADVALVTPIKDGMNLVAKEYCICGPDDGALVLSEFAGAAAQLRNGAILVNPYDVEGMASAIYTALSMPPNERAERIARMRKNVMSEDLAWWVEFFLQASHPALAQERRTLNVLTAAA